MTLCPVALAVGCSKCPIYRPCPLKGVIGDYKPESPRKETASARTTEPRKRK
jgi:hypothetical protein